MPCEFGDVVKLIEIIALKRSQKKNKNKKNRYYIVTHSALFSIESICQMA
jgi:hypothetical protein